MIIDIHRHIVDRTWQSEQYWRSFAGTILPILKRIGRPATIDSIVKEILPNNWDTDGSKHLARMDEGGIEKAVIFAFDVGLISGEPAVGIQEQNRIIFDLARQHPDRFIPFVHIDPRRPGAKDFVRRGIEEGGAKGLKLHPGAGFNPEEKETLDLVESIAGKGLPVLTHTGPSGPSTSSRFCEPIYLDALLLRFPEVNFIAAHLAYGYRHPLFSLGVVRPNLFVDFSAWQTTARRRYSEFARAVKEAVSEMGPERVLFGTDNPYLWGVMPESRFVQSVRDLTHVPPEEGRLTEAEVELILGGNARRLLGLEENDE